MADNKESEGCDETKQDIMSESSHSIQSFDTEINILTKANMNIFTFTGYPNSGTGNSDPKNIADQISRTATDNWAKYGYQTSQDNNGIAYIQIDLKTPYYITKYAVSGYPGSKHRPTSVYYLRASNDAKKWINVGMSDIATWHNDGKGTYPFRGIQHVTDPGFYRYYQFYGVGYDNKHLLIMNAGLWTPQVMSYNKWKISQEMNKIISKSSYHPMAKWKTNHVIYWISNMINWGNKTEEKEKCISELKDWDVTGKDFIKADKETLRSLNIKNPLIQQRILDGRDIIIQNPQIVVEVMNSCNDNKFIIQEIQNDLQLIKKELSQIKNNDNYNINNDMIESGILNLAGSWSHYGGQYKQAKWFKIGKIVIVQGLIKSSNFGSKHMATLPQNCCPKQRVIFSLDQHSVSFRVDLLTNGKIEWVNGNNTHNWISLGGMVFTVE